MEQGLKFFIVALTSLILVFISIAVAFIMFYRNRKLMFLNEKQQLEDRMKTEMLNIKTEVQEQTLHHVCQELHDNIGQKLSVARIYINRLESSRSEEHDKQELKSISGTLGESIDELRNIVNTLNPEAITKRRLAEALRLEQQRINQSKLAICNLTVEGKPTEFDDDRRDLILYRISQEFIQNSLKHSGCRHIDINLNFGEADFIMTLSDDGCGFDFNNPEKARNGNGLTNMQNRAGIIGGRVNLGANVPSGTKLQLVLPLP
jgi:two-component system, NarL family, sensor kinase